MNSLSMESIFLALSGVILLAGVLYWFWSHIQLTQKKVQLLENAVFELRGMLQRGGSSGDPDGLRSPDGLRDPGLPPLPVSDDDASPPRSPSGPFAAVSSMYNDLGDDDWKEEAEVVEGAGNGVDVSAGSTPLSALGLHQDQGSSDFADFPVFQEEAVNPDLQPGGRIQVVEEEGGSKAEQFRDLFTSPPASLSEATSLDAMPVKDLRRLAEQRGIANASELRKKEILAALKAQAGPPSATAGATSNNPTTVVQLEKTLDLTEVAEILE